MNRASFDRTKYYNSLTLEELHDHSQFIFDVIQSKHAALYGNSIDNSSQQLIRDSGPRHKNNGQTTPLLTPFITSQLFGGELWDSSFVIGKDVLMNLTVLLPQNTSPGITKSVQQLSKVFITMSVLFKAENGLFLKNSVVNVGIHLTEHQVAEFVRHPHLITKNGENKLLSNSTLMAKKATTEANENEKFLSIERLFKTSPLTKIYDRFYCPIHGDAAKNSSSLIPSSHQLQLQHQMLSGSSSGVQSILSGPYITPQAPIPPVHSQGSAQWKYRNKNHKTGATDDHTTDSKVIPGATNDEWYKRKFDHIATSTNNTSSSNKAPLTDRLSAPLIMTKPPVVDRFSNCTVGTPVNLQLKGLFTPQKLQTITGAELKFVLTTCISCEIVSKTDTHVILRNSLLSALLCLHQEVFNKNVSDVMSIHFCHISDRKLLSIQGSDDVVWITLKLLVQRSCYVYSPPSNFPSSKGKQQVGVVSSQQMSDFHSLLSDDGSASTDTAGSSSSSGGSGSSSSKSTSQSITKTPKAEHSSTPAAVPIDPYYCVDEEEGNMYW